LKDYFDVIVIGGGLAGLCAGAYITRSQHSLLLCEQADQTGGYFRTFNNNGFHFDAGIKAIENAGMLIPMLKQLGLENKVDLRRYTSALALNEQFLSLRNNYDFNHFFNILGRKFPHEQKGLKLLSSQADRIGRWVDVISTLPNPLFENYKSILPRMPVWFFQNIPGLLKFKSTGKLLEIPLTEFLAKYVSDRSLINILSELFFYGTPAIFGLGYSKVFMDYYYPYKGVQSLTDSLSDYIMEHGGEIKTNSRVKRIITENGRVKGVQLENDNIIKAKFVISASDMHSTFIDMLYSPETPVRYRERLQKADIGESSVCVFLSVDIPPDKIPVQGCPHIYFMPDDEGIGHEDSMDIDFFARSPIEISIPSLINPELAPNGKSAVIVSAVARYDFHNNWNLNNHHSSNDYCILKEKVADQLTETAAKLIPGLKEHIISRHVATPHTYHRYTLNTGGSICGWTYDRINTFHQKGTGSGVRNSVLTPIKGLLQSGHWTMYPGGAPVCILTGRLAADYICRQFGRSSE
jgi:phytoene dehydrogenase-like protein